MIDANNYYPERDGHVVALDNLETTTSEMLAVELPGARVVKAFNAILAKDLEVDGRRAGAADRRALPIAADEQGAKAQVMQLTDELGFDPVDAGGLADSWRFERGTPVYCVRLDRGALVAGLALAERTKDVVNGF